MQVQCINKLQYSYNFQRKNKVIDEGDYVKIPKKKYEKDNIMINILGIMVFFELLCTIYKSFKS